MAKFQLASKFELLGEALLLWCVGSICDELPIYSTFVSKSERNVLMKSLSYLERENGKKM